MQAPWVRGPRSRVETCIHTLEVQSIQHGPEVGHRICERTNQPSRKLSLGAQHEPSCSPTDSGASLLNFSQFLPLPIAMPCVILTGLGLQQTSDVRHSRAGWYAGWLAAEI